MFDFLKLISITQLGYGSNRTHKIQNSQKFALLPFPSKFGIQEVDRFSQSPGDFGLRQINVLKVQYINSDHEIYRIFFFLFFYIRILRLKLAKFSEYVKKKTKAEILLRTLFCVLLENKIQ